MSHYEPVVFRSSPPEVLLEARCMTCGASQTQETATYTFADQHHDLAEWWALHKDQCLGNKGRTQ